VVLQNILDQPEADHVKASGQTIEYFGLGYQQSKQK